MVIFGYKDFFMLRMLKKVTEKLYLLSLINLSLSLKNSSGVMVNQLSISSKLVN